MALKGPKWGTKSLRCPFCPLEVSYTVNATISTPSSPRLPSSSSSLAVAKHHRLLLRRGLMQMTAFPTLKTDGLFGQRPSTSHDGPWEALRHFISSWSQRFAVSASCSGHGCLLRWDVNQCERSGQEALQVQFASTPLHCAIWVADDSLRCHAPEVRLLAVLGR